MLDWKGNMNEKRDRNQRITSDVHAEATLLAFMKISRIESNKIDNILQRSDSDSEGKVQPCWRPINKAAD